MCSTPLCSFGESSRGVESKLMLTAYLWWRTIAAKKASLQSTQLAQHAMVRSLPVPKKRKAKLIVN